VPAGTPLWKCSGAVDYSDAAGSSYWADCESVTLPEDVGVFPTTVDHLVNCFVAPATTAPHSTTVAGEPSATWVEVTPCDVCVDVPATTASHPPTVPGEPHTTWVGVVSCELPPATTAPPTTAPIELDTTTTSISCESDDDSVTITVPCATVAPVPISEDEQRYVVVPGDSLMAIAERYGISAVVIVDYNAWTDGTDHQLFPGDEILIPPMAVIPGDR